MSAATVLRRPATLDESPRESWRLVERYTKRYPDDWRCVFRKGDELLEVSVPEEVWRAFDA